MYSSDFKAQIDRDASTSKPPEELPSMYHSKFSAQLLASRTGKPVVVPLWPYGDLQMNGDQAPEIPMYDEPIASPQQTESEKFVTKFFFVWFILVGAFAAMIFGNVMPPGINPLIYLTGASALALSLCRNSRGISFIAVREYDICFLWFVAGKLEKKEKLDYYSLRKIELVEPDRFGKPKIRFSAGIRGTSKTIPLESFPSRERWRYFLDACRKCNSNLQVDPAIEEKLMPDPKDAGYTELWLEALGAPPKRERLLPLDSGTTLNQGAYKILRQLGAGGQGTAYLATTHGAKKNGIATSDEVVLKEYMLPVYVDMKARKKALEDFEHEARMLSRLSSDSIVKLLDFFAEDHRAYLVLEYIPGDSLRSLVEKNGPVSEKDAVAIGIGMCDILQYLQEQQPPVVHRDFTPDNLIRRNDGKVKLIDFMVAQEGDAESMTSSIVGKQAYMPPEQFRGQAGIRSDIYACGGILFFLLTGQDPEALSQSNILLVRDDISVELHDIIARATSLDEKARFASAREMRQALNALA